MNIFQHIKTMGFLLLLLASLSLGGIILLITMPKQYDHKFKEGDFVELILDHRQGQVIRVDPLDEPVVVRLARSESLQQIYEFELKPSTLNKENKKK